MTNKFILYFFCVSITLVFATCKNNSNQVKDITTPADTVSKTGKDTVDKFTQFKYDMIISNIPFPFEMLDKLFAAKIVFNQKFTNPISNISKYGVNNSKALNLGIYGADLAYSVTFEQFQQIGPYVKNTKKLAEDLNIPLAFNQETMDKYNKYKDNKDSLAKAIFDSYIEVDKTLKSNERIGMAGLVVAGSWLEGLYLATKSYVETPKNLENKDVYNIIWRQKLHLDNIIKLLADFKNEPYFAGVLNELNDIKSVYDHLAIGSELNEKELILLNQKVEKLRNRIIEGA
jgi:hypothetical protein